MTATKSDFGVNGLTRTRLLTQTAPTVISAGTIAGLYAVARKKLPCNSWWVARKDPQPGQYSPVNMRKGQGGNNPLPEGSTKNRMSAAATTAKSMHTASRDTPQPRKSSMVSGSSPHDCHQSHESKVKHNKCKTQPE
jgi:hypothetical protein